MKTNFFLLFLIFSQALFAQTTINDGEKISGTWNKSGSPYIVEGEAIVPRGKTLTIKAGVVVKFKTGNDRDYRIDGDLNPYFNVGFLRVKGTLVAKGKKKKPILFTHDSKYGNWGNIFFENSKANHLKYCKFEYGFYIRMITEDDNGTGVTSFYNSSGIVENCIYENNGWAAINCKKNSNPLVKNNTIIDNKYGLECNSRSVPEIINTIFWNNETCFYLNGSSRPKISYSMIQDSFLLDGIKDNGNNVFRKDPQLDKDYKPKTKSPCKKTGENGKNIGAF